MHVVLVLWFATKAICLCDHYYDYRAGSLSLALSPFFLDHLVFVLENRPLSTLLKGLEVGAEITLTCEIRSLCQSCSPVIEFYREYELNQFLPVTDSYWDVSYQRKCIRSGNLLACSLVIPIYSTEYNDNYQCVWWESRNRNINESHTFRLGKP